MGKYDRWTRGCLEREVDKLAEQNEKMLEEMQSILTWMEPTVINGKGIAQMVEVGPLDIKRLKALIAEVEAT